MQPSSTAGSHPPGTLFVSFPVGGERYETVRARIQLPGSGILGADHLPGKIEILLMIQYFSIHTNAHGGAGYCGRTENREFCDCYQAISGDVYSRPVLKLVDCNPMEQPSS